MDRERSLPRKGAAVRGSQTARSRNPVRERFSTFGVAARVMRSRWRREGIVAVLGRERSSVSISGALAPGEVYTSNQHKPRSSKVL